MRGSSIDPTMSMARCFACIIISSCFSTQCGWCRSYTMFIGFAGSMRQATLRMVFGGAATRCIADSRNRAGSRRMSFFMLGRGAYDRQSQEEAYRKLFDRTPEPSHASLFRRGSAEDPRILGDAQFMANVWRVTGRRLP